MAVGSVLMITGWYRVAGEPGSSDQVGPFGLAVLGLLVLVAGQLSWFRAGRRAVARRRRRLLGRAPRKAVVGADASGDAFAGGARFYHRLDCPMVSGREWSAHSRAIHLAAGRDACGVCSP
jgi:hypothetical protein